MNNDNNTLPCVATYTMKFYSNIQVNNAYNNCNIVAYCYNIEMHFTIL